MGFDAETKAGHRIYWPERRMISVERSVKFNFETNDVVVGVLPLEGEKPDDEHLTTIESDKPHVDFQTSDVEVEAPVPVPEPVEGRGKCIRKETEYVKMLREGSAITGSKGGPLPKGMRPGTSVEE